MATLTLPTAARLQVRRARRSAAAVPSGVWYMVVAALAFSAMNALVKAVAAELPTMEIVFARTVLMGLLTLGMLKRAGVSPIGTNHRLLFARGAIGATALSLLYTIHYTAPVWTALTAAFFLRERIGPWVIAGTVVSLAGVMMIAQPQFLFGGAGLDPLAVGAAVVASLLAGSVYTIVRKLRETDHPLVIVLSLAWVGALGSAPFVLLGGWTWPSGTAWALLLARHADRAGVPHEEPPPAPGRARDGHRLRPDRLRLRPRGRVLRHHPECVEPPRRRARPRVRPLAQPPPARGVTERPGRPVEDRPGTS